MTIEKLSIRRPDGTISQSQGTFFGSMEFILEDLGFIIESDPDPRKPTRVGFSRETKWSIISPGYRTVEKNAKVILPNKGQFFLTLRSPFSRSDLIISGRNRNDDPR